MIGDVDAQLGRVFDALAQFGQWDDTFVLVTSDHGEQLGDHGLIQKLGYFEESYRVLGIVRNPLAPGPTGPSSTPYRERRLLPTICEISGSRGAPTVRRATAHGVYRGRIRRGGARRRPGSSTGGI